METTGSVTESAIPGSMTWYEVLREALLHPSVETFRRIVNDPRGSMMRVFWLMAAYYAVVGVFLILLISLFIDDLVPAYVQADLTLLLIMVGVVILFSPVLTVIGLYISAWVLGLVAALFGGSGSTGRLAYVLGMVGVLTVFLTFPLSMVTTAISALGGPIGSLGSLCTTPISLAITLYTVFLQVQAVRAEENLSAGKAFLTVIIPMIVLIAFGFVCLLLSVIPAVQQAGGWR